MLLRMFNSQKINFDSNSTRPSIIGVLILQIIILLLMFVGLLFW